MRFQTHGPSLDALESQLDLRQIERGVDPIEVLAPKDWTQARIDAWLDWAATPPPRPPRLTMTCRPSTPGRRGPGRRPGPLCRPARRPGRNVGLFAGREDAIAFRNSLFASLILGHAAPASTGPNASEPDVVDLSGFEFSAAVERHRRPRAATPLMQDALDAQGARLQAVMDAIARCEGDSRGLRRSQSQYRPGPRRPAGARGWCQRHGDSPRHRSGPGRRGRVALGRGRAGHDRAPASGRPARRGRSRRTGRPQGGGGGVGERSGHIGLQPGRRGVRRPCAERLPRRHRCQPL